MELEQKLYSPKEIANFLGISAKSFSNNRKKKLEELSLYCDFTDLGRKGIQVNSVKISEYLGKARDIVRRDFKEAWHENPNSLKFAANYIYTKNKPVLTVQYNTIYQYTCSTKREWYGVPRITGGTRGHCNWVYAVVDKKNERFRYLTEEEQKIRKEMLHRFFKDADERIEEVKTLQLSLKLGEITTEQYAAESDKILGIAENGDWDNFNAEFIAAIGEDCEYALELIDNALLTYNLREPL